MSRVNWLVVIWRETYAEVTPFEEETEARDFYANASLQWTESYLCKVIAGLGVPS